MRKKKEKTSIAKRIFSCFLILALCVTFSLPAVSAEEAPEVVESELLQDADVLMAQTADEQVRIGIAFTNDIHARVAGTTNKDGSIDTIGMPRLKTIVNAIAEGKDMSLVLDGGDMFHGQSIATLVNGESVATLAEAVGYDAMVSGNHDWNYGKDQLKTLETLSNLTILAGNVRNTSDDSAFFGENDYITKEVTKNEKTIKVGVFGMIDPAIYDMTNPTNVDGLAFTDMTVYANQAVAYLRSADGGNCDIVVGLTHCVNPQEVASKVDGVDLWLSGHEHVEINEDVQTPNGGTAKVVQTGMYMQHVGDIEITCPENYKELNDSQRKEELKISVTMINGEMASAYEEDETVKSILNQIQEDQKPILDRVVGESSISMDWSWESVRSYELAIGNVLTDAYIKETGADVAIENSGGIRASLPQGNITYGNIISVLPYGNYLVTKKISGAELKSVMETSLDIMLKSRAALEAGDNNAYPSNSGSAMQIGGMKVSYRADGAQGERIDSLKINGTEAVDTDIYSVAMNNFTATNTDYPEIVEKPIEHEYAACDEAVIRYFKAAEEKSGDASITKSSLINRIENRSIAFSGKTPEQISNQMTLDQKIGQMIMPAFRSYNNIDVTTINDAIWSAVETYGFGGVILFAENTQGTEQTTRLITDFQNAANLPLMVAIDQEGGSVARLQTGTSLGGNMALGATRSAELTTQAASVIGNELSALGVNVDFAPDVDVNNNPSNPVIGVRSFSDDPNLVATLGTSFITGLHNQNVATAIKHFPGHGDTGTDSHTGLPQINKSYDEIKQCELIPFQSGINAGTDIVMTAHIQYPQIETNRYTSKATGEQVYIPATLSKSIITNILRGDMGYDGVISTDAMNMDAIAKNFDATDAAVMAVNADVDILLMPVDMSTDEGIASMNDYIQHIVQQVEAGTISEQTITKSANRILTLKQERGILNQPQTDVETKVIQAKTSVGSKEHHDQEWSIMQKGITLLKNEQQTLPIQVKQGEKVALFCSYLNEVNSMTYAMERLKSEGILPTNVNYEIYCFKDKKIADFESAIKEATYVFASVETYRAANMNPADAAGWQSLFLDQLIDKVHAQGKKIVVTSIALPYDVARYQKADALLAAYGSNGMDEIPTEYNGETKTYGPNLPVAVCMAFGEAVPTGKLPVNIMKIDEKYGYTSEILYSNGYGLINWGKTVNPQKTNPKKIGVATGDDTDLHLYCMMVILSVGMIVIVARRKKREI